MKNRLNKFIIIFIIIIALSSFCFVLSSCINVKPDGPLDIIVHTTIACDGTKLEDGKTYNVNYNDIAFDTKWLKFEYKIKGEKKYLTADNNYSKKFDIYYADLEKITSVYEIVYNKVEYLKYENKFSFPKPGTHEIVVSFNEKMIDSVSSQISLDYEKSLFKFTLKVA